MKAVELVARLESQREPNEDLDRLVVELFRPQTNRYLEIAGGAVMVVDKGSPECVIVTPIPKVTRYIDAGIELLPIGVWCTLEAKAKSEFGRNHVALHWINADDEQVLVDATHETSIPLALCLALVRYAKGESTMTPLRLVR